MKEGGLLKIGEEEKIYPYGFIHADFYLKNMIKDNTVIADGYAGESEVKGGGIFAPAGLCAIAIYNSSFIGNDAIVTTPGYTTGIRTAYGGGIAGTTVYVDRCTIMDNTAHVDQQSYGKKNEVTIYFLSPLTITGGNIIVPAAGGGIAVFSNGAGTNYWITNCLIIGNTARSDNQTSGDYKALGGGVAFADDNVLSTTMPFAGNTIVGNQVITTNTQGVSYGQAYGGGIGFGNFADGSGLATQRMTNCIIWDNRADTNHGLQIASLCKDWSDTDIKEGIYVQHCDVQGGESGVYYYPDYGWFCWGYDTTYPYYVPWHGDGNIGDDPEDNPNFVNPGYWEDDFFVAGDYHLQSSSPLINHGDSTLLPQDRPDFDHDGSNADHIPYDFDNGARENGMVDIGADEYGSASLLLPPQTPVGPMKGIKGNPYLYTIYANLENFGWPFYYQPH